MSFLFALAYLLVEYVRPQSSYEFLSGLPLGQAVIVGFLAACILEGRARLTKHSINWLLLAYLAWFAVSYVFAVRRDLALQPLFDFTKWVIIYFLLINTINTERRLYIFVVALLLLNFKYAQFATRLWVSNGFYSDPRGLNAGGGIGAGFFQNPNDFGIAINSVLGLSYFLARGDANRWIGFIKTQWLYLACAATMGIAIIASSSRGAALGMAATAVTVWYKGRHKVISLAAIAVIALGVVAMIPDDNWNRFRTMGSSEDGSGQSRLALWNAGIRMANENPLTGVGPNNFVYVNTEIYYSQNRVVQHNVFIQAASDHGYPALIILLLMIYASFKSQRQVRLIIKERKLDAPYLYALSHGIDASIVAFCVNGFFITVLYYPFIWILFVLSVALKDVVEQRLTVEASEPAHRPDIATQ